MRTSSIIAALGIILPGIIFVNTARAWTMDSRIQVISPANNSQVYPGQSVLLKVVVDPSVEPLSVGVITGKGRIKPIIMNSPPYEANVDIPRGVTGVAVLRVVVKTVHDTAVYGPEITLYIIPEEAPASLDVEAGNLFHLQSSPTDPIDTKKLLVRGNYADGAYRNISGSLFGTTYTSSDPSVATVDAEGVITPVSPGYAYITVEHKGLKVFSEAQVNPVTGALPPVEQTSKMNIQAGGFRLDRTKGAYMHQVTVTNMSSLPLPIPLHLVLEGLPNGVRLYQNNSVTKNITPLGSPWEFIDIDPLRFLSPGQSYTLTLEFVNMYGVPITYTPKVYTVMDP